MEGRIASGRYKNPSEVLRAGLRLREQQNSVLKTRPLRTQEAAAGFQVCRAALKEDLVARSRSSSSEPGTKAPVADTGWVKLTWDELELWAGIRSVARGRTYQRGGRVKNLRISRDGELLATVVGGDRYVTTVALVSERKQRQSLRSSCTCPVGIHCKHAVAVVADYLQAIAEGRNVPLASEDDPRWAARDGDSPEFDEDWDDEDESSDTSWEDEDEDEDEDAPPLAKTRGRKRAARPEAAQVNWDDKIEQHLRAKTQGELADLVWSLTRRFPEIYQEFRERIALQEGNVERLVAEARRAIRQVTSEPAWRNDWTGDGHIPDYSKIRHRFERLLELGHADEVVSLGREFLQRGMEQVGQSHDEGDTAMAFGECLPVVFEAVTRSRLSGPERLLFAIDAGLSDDYDVIGDASNAVFETCSRPENWSAVADALAQRLKATPAPEISRLRSFHDSYQRDHITSWIARALENAGRAGELRSLYEAEVRVTGSYERFVQFLLKQRQFEDAERWAREGITATSAELPGIAARLATNLCELAQQRKQWDVVAAHAAHNFFSDHPSPSLFDELVKAARKAGVEDPVRTAALRFLETGAMPYQVITPRSAAAMKTKPSVRKSATTTRPSVKKSAAATRAAASHPESTPASSHVKIDPTWPLPVPDYLIPLLDRPQRYDSAPRPHLKVLLEMAIAAKRPDDVLHWFDKMRSVSRGPSSWNNPLDHADRVAAAVSAAYPERALEIYRAALDAQLTQAQYSAYESAVGYLRKLRPLYEALDRAGEWTALVASIREEYRRRPRFMELLDGLEGRTIVQSARSRR